VGVTSPDPEATITFLVDVLGFGISELLTTDDRQRTLSALLFRTNNGQDIAVYPGIDPRLHHVAFAKEDEVDILRDATWLRQDGVQLDLYGPTRQSYGRTFSVHFHDPCGIRYELCAGGRFSELHPQFQPVRWTEANLGKALAFYDNVENKEFFTPSL
jgi:catechol 2,3-dioxygenase